MATDSADRCAICLHSSNNAAFIIPCLHRFCFICIWQRAQIKPVCPVCRKSVTSIQPSLQGDRFGEFPVRRQPPVALSGRAQDETADTLPVSRASTEHQPQYPQAGYVSGRQPYNWKLFFSKHPGVFENLRPWLRQELRRISRLQLPRRLMLEQVILSTLAVDGPNEESLVERLQNDLGNNTAKFVRGLVEFTMEHCGRATQHLFLRGEPRAARRLEERHGSLLSSKASMEWRDRSPLSSTRSGVSRGGPEQSPMASTSCPTFQEGGKLNLLALTRSAGVQESRERSPVASSSSEVASQAGQELNVVASTNLGTSSGDRELSPVANTSPAAAQGRSPCNPVALSRSAGFQGGRERSPIASTSWAALQEGREQSPLTSTSLAASRGGSPVPRPAPSSSAATADEGECLGTSTAALREGPGCPLSISSAIPGEQEELHGERGEAAAGASACTGSGGWSRQGPQRPLKRKASSTEDSDAKKPARC